MMRVKSIIIWSLFPVLMFAGNKIESTYTSIESKDCTTLSTNTFGGAFACEAYGNINVEVVEEDLRQSITLIRNKKRYPLEMWTSVSSSFSFLGNKIEWRFPKKEKNQPIAMITRYNVSIGEYLEQTNSYLAVVKITNNEMCVVGKVKPQREQNILAREMADKAQSLTCVLKEKK